MENEKIKQKPKKSSRGGKQTLFRVTYRTQINLIRIADSKANMILGINTLIITILVGLISSKLIFTTPESMENHSLIIPVLSIILTALLSAIYAIRSAKPRLIRPVQEKDPLIMAKKSYLFFENVYSMKLDEYINTMEELIDSSKSVYQNMIIDIYNQSKVLHQKYRLLRTSYQIFTYGLVISIALFIFFWLIVRQPAV
ncbi:MAG: metal-dependent phosphohydrolase [Cyclobacteriaceae bacterium]|nr:metal-dependent phosphohydrolase [Cyclobacteriaceae bacterium]